MPGKTPSEVYAEVVDRLIPAANGDPRIRALWIEGDSMAELRRPYGKLELHLAADEPDFSAVLTGLEAMVQGHSKLTSQRWSDVPRFARELSARIDGAAVTVIIERTSLLAKRPRKAVLALSDKTGNLTHVMDFSKYRS